MKSSKFADMKKAANPADTKKRNQRKAAAKIAETKKERKRKGQAQNPGS